MNIEAGYRGGTHWEEFGDSILLAEGVCTQGLAGRMGGHVVRMYIVTPGSYFIVHRTGRLYGAPSEMVVLYDGETVRLGTLDEIFPPASRDTAGNLFVEGYKYGIENTLSAYFRLVFTVFTISYNS